GAEGAFLDRLAQALKLPAAQARAYVEQADAIAAVPGVPGGAPAAAGAAAPVAGVDAAAIDKQIVDASITNAALELLPESLASMAILPLQVRLVYKIGKAYGYELDQGHIKEFIAALGVGLTGQYLEQFGRKLLGGLLGSVLGGMGRTIGKQAASSGMAFASTWALGQVARQYYASGRKLDMEKLKSAFTPLVQQGQTMIQQYGPQISERARSINVRSLPQLIGR
ncbi:MAG: GTPase, partial [Burkholderiales bacterium]|nr:GTPase [Burkholderiales bacterium]